MHRHPHAQGARLVAPRNDEAREQAGQVGGYGETESPNCAEVQAERKAFATIQAQLAMRGFALTGLIAGPFTIARWDRTVECVDVEAVRAFAQRVGIPK